MSRWQEIKKTTPSGKTLFVCMSCGRQSPSCESKCPAPEQYHTVPGRLTVPCEFWPMDEEAYANSMLARADGYIIGTLCTPMGLVAISTPVSRELAREIELANAHHKLASTQTSDRSFSEGIRWPDVDMPIKVLNESKPYAMEHYIKRDRRKP